jgi:hypothetical protein
VIVVLIELYNWYARYTEGTVAVLPTGLVLSFIVVCMLVFAGWKGWEMVYRHRVGVTDEVATGQAWLRPRRRCEGPPDRFITAERVAITERFGGVALRRQCRRTAEIKHGESTCVRRSVEFGKARGSSVVEAAPGACRSLGERARDHQCRLHRQRV